MILHPFVDSIPSIGADTLDVTMVLIRRSLPRLVPFLIEMNDGFVGEGGYTTGILYVEHSTLKL